MKKGILVLLLALVLANLTVPSQVAVAIDSTCSASIWIAEAPQTDQHAILRVEITGVRPPIPWVDSSGMPKLAEGDHAVLLHLARPLPVGTKVTVLPWPTGITFAKVNPSEYLVLRANELRTKDISGSVVVFILYISARPDSVHVKGIQTWGAAIPPEGRPGQNPHWCDFYFYWYPKGSR